VAYASAKIAANNSIQRPDMYAANNPETPKAAQTSERMAATLRLMCPSLDFTVRMVL
jgi:hypothetical protein